MKWDRHPLRRGAPLPTTPRIDADSTSKDADFGAGMTPASRKGVPAETAVAAWEVSLAAVICAVVFVAASVVVVAVVARST